MLQPEDDFRFSKQIRVTFDPNLSREIMMSMTRTVQNREVKYMPYELVRNFMVRAMREGKAIYEKEILENNKRLCIFDLEKPAEADTVEVEVDATYGCDNARIFEIRLY